MSRPSTPPQRLPDGSTRVTVKCCCNGCGHELGDATQAELSAAICGDLPDVRGECPNCTPATPICPECAQLKHRNCTGWALDETTDQITTCACEQAGHEETR